MVYNHKSLNYLMLQNSLTHPKGESAQFFNII